MKKILGILIITIFNVNIVFGSSNDVIKLKCQIVNKPMNIVIDQKIVDYPTNRKPILLLLGADQLMGTVRDFIGSTSKDRILNIQLSYGFPGGQNQNGIGTAQAKYRLDQDISTAPLAEVEMTDPDTLIVYSIQCFLTK